MLYARAGPATAGAWCLWLCGAGCEDESVVVRQGGGQAGPGDRRSPPTPQGSAGAGVPQHGMSSFLLRRLLVCQWLDENVLSMSQELPTLLRWSHGHILPLNSDSN